MSDSLRKQIEALPRYDVWADYDDVLIHEREDGVWISRAAVLALLPPEYVSGVCPTCGRDDYGLSIPERPAVCPACHRVNSVDKAQGATTFCVNPWHE